MKIAIVSLFLAGAIANLAAADKFYDTTKFAWWSESVSDNGERGVIFVSKADTVGKTAYIMRYQKYGKNTLIENDTVLQNWHRSTWFGSSRFSLALDKNGWAHLAYSDSEKCVYATNYADTQWRTRYRSKLSAGCTNGRLNSIAITNNQLDIVYSSDYTVWGGYPFSIMFRISGDVRSDSVVETGITSSHDIYDEQIYDIAISNRCDRLVVAYGLRQYGGWAARRIIVSEGFPKITDFHSLVLRSAYRAYITVCPLKIMKDDPPRIIISFPYGNDTVTVLDSGLTGIRAPHNSPKAFGRRSDSAGRKSVDLCGRVLPGHLRSEFVSGMYFLPPADGVGQAAKRLQIGR